MTSEVLVGLLSGYISIGDAKVPVSPDEIYFSASQAQYDILRSMKILERVCNIVLVKDQERYHYSLKDITEVSDSSKMITAVGHGLHTGDSVQVLCSGLTGFYESITVLDEDTLTLDGTTSGTMGAVTGKICHSYLGVQGVKGDELHRTDNNGGVLKRRSIEFIQNYSKTLNTAPVSGVVRFYEIFDEPKIIGFQAIPQADMPIQFIGFRIPIDGIDDVSDDVNPMLPREYDNILFLYTKRAILLTKSDTPGIDMAVANCDKLIAGEARKKGLQLRIDRQAEQINPNQLRME